MPPHPGLFLRSRLVQKVGGFDESFLVAGDFDIITRLFQLDNAIFEYLPMVSVKMLPGGISNNSFKSIILLNKEVLRSGRQNGINISWLRLVMKYFYKVHELIFFTVRDWVGRFI